MFQFTNIANHCYEVIPKNTKVILIGFSNLAAHGGSKNRLFPTAAGANVSKAG